MNIKILLSIIFLLVLQILPAEWTILETYSIPGKASGLAFDGTNLYFGIYGSNGDHVYRFNIQTESYELLFVNEELDDSFGMTWDGASLWITHHPNNPAVAVKLDLAGNILSQFDLPDQYMSGIAYNDGNFWVATYYPDDPGIIYLVDDNGSILEQINFDLPENNDEQPWDICIQDDDLWIADYNDDTLYKIDQTGNILEEHPGENIKPAGIVYDGSYLWYIDGPLSSNSTLYKVDLGGAGTPEIVPEWVEYDFGNTVIGSPAVTELVLTNNGTADLEITAIQFNSPGFSVIFQPPLILAPSFSTPLSITFSPEAWGEYSAQMLIISNDPIEPEVAVDLTGYGILPEQEIVLDQDELQWNNVRTGAVSGHFLLISNQGYSDLLIDDLQFETTSFFIDNTVELPLSLSTREEYQLRIWFSPQDEGTFNDILTIYSNDADEAILPIMLTGNSLQQEYPIGTELWEYEIYASYDNSPKAMHWISDVSEDGIADLIVCSEDGYVRCFNGNSSNLADVLWEYPLPAGYVYSQKGLDIGIDANDDGYDDLIIGTAGGDKAVRMISGRSGELIWEYLTSEYGEGGWVYQVYWEYDYNQDQYPDVLACAGDDVNDNGPKRVICLDGLTGNPIWDHYAGGPVFSVTGIEDVNNDGMNDVLAGASDQYETEGRVLALDDSLVKYSQINSPDLPEVWALAQVGDFTSDGIPDVIAGDFYGTCYWINGDNGDVVWTMSIGEYTLITNFQVLDDVNDDDHPDVLIAHSGNSAIVISGSSGDQLWSQYIGDNSLSIARIPDLNGDLINDVLIGSLNSNSYFLNGVNGDILNNNYFGSAVDAIAAIPDVTGDNSWEMVAGLRNGFLYCLSGGLDSIVNSDDNEIPDNSNLNISLSNYPNPFNPSTVISFKVSDPIQEKAQAGVSHQNPELMIYNIKGQQIKKYSFSDLQYSIIWDGTDNNCRKMSSGIYFCKLKVGKNTAVRKIVLMK